MAKLYTRTCPTCKHVEEKWVLEAGDENPESEGHGIWLAAQIQGTMKEIAKAMKATKKRSKPSGKKADRERA